MGFGGAFRLVGSNDMVDPQSRSFEDTRVTPLEILVQMECVENICCAHRRDERDLLIIHTMLTNLTVGEGLTSSTSPSPSPGNAECL